MALHLPYNPNNGAPPPLPGPIALGVQNNLFASVTWTPIPPPDSIPILPRSRSQTFHFFRLLPPELRLKIWSHTLSHRVIELRSWGTGRYCPTRFSITPHRLPVLFRVCRESRTEALRIYELVKVGVSAAQLKDTLKYVEWKYHPTNPQANPEFTVGTAPLPYAIPHPPVPVYLNWDYDTIYLGPEFHAHHLHNFLTVAGAGHELYGVQRIALSHTLWEGSRTERRDELREALFALKSRPVSEVVIVPDDVVGALEDRWYYRRHEIRFMQPDWGYSFRPSGGEKAPNVEENLGAWFQRLWGAEEKVEDEDDDESVTTCGEMEKREVPTVCVKSIRRNGHLMANFRNGMWGIQDAMGDMRYWKTWNPPQTAQTS